MENQLLKYTIVWKSVYFESTILPSHDQIMLLQVQ